jgi:hypothetical protein
MVYIKIVIPYAPLTMTILDVFLYFKSQTGNQVISVDETIDRNGKHKSFTICANAQNYHPIFRYMNNEYRIVRYMKYRNKWAKIRAWIYEN